MRSRAGTAPDADELVSSILLAARTLMGVSARSLSALDESVTLPQFRLLMILDTRGAANVNAIAAMLDVGASSAVRMIDRLVAAELVSREENPSNRREVIVRLTELGSAVVARVRARRRKEISHIVSAMDPDEREAVATALRAFAQAAGEQQADAPDVTADSLGW